MQLRRRFLDGFSCSSQIISKTIRCIISNFVYTWLLFLSYALYNIHLWNFILTISAVIKKKLEGFPGSSQIILKTFVA